MTDKETFIAQLGQIAQKHIQATSLQLQKQRKTERHNTEMQELNSQIEPLRTESGDLLSSAIKLGPGTDEQGGIIMAGGLPFFYKNYEGETELRILPLLT